MATLAAARTRRAGGLFSPLGFAIVVVLVLLLVFTLGGFSYAPSSSDGSAGSSSDSSYNGGSSSGSRSGTSAVPSYGDVPEFGISLSLNLPTWALCPQHPCKYSAMADGTVNTSVRGALISLL